MSKKRKHLSRTEALARVSTAPKVTLDASAPRETLARFTQEYDAEQNAPVEAAKQEVSASLRRLIDQDQPTLYVAESSFLTATAPAIGDGSQFNGVAPEELRARSEE